MSQRYGTIVTDVGKGLIAEALAKGEKLSITKAAVGDGGGTYYMPNPGMVELKRQIWSGGINSVEIGESTNTIEVTAVVPSHVGGFTIREIAVYTDSDDIFAICNTPDTEKVLITSGAIGEMEIKIRIEVSNTDVITFVVDPNIIAATKRDLEKHDKSANAHENLLGPIEEKTEENTTAIEMLEEDITEIRDETQTKVDKEQGKGLSTNDFTTTYRQQIDGNKQNIALLQSDKEPLIKNAPIKTSMVDADTMPLSDSTTANLSKKISFANLKTSLKSYFDTLYSKYTHPTYTVRSAGLYKTAVDSTGHVSTATLVTANDLPAASTTQKGVVQLSDSVANTSNVQAATPSAVKQVYDMTKIEAGTVNLYRELHGLTVGSPRIDDMLKCISDNMGIGGRRMATIEFTFTNATAGNAVQPLSNIPFRLLKNTTLIGSYVTDANGKVYINSDDETAAFTAEFQPVFPMWTTVKTFQFFVPPLQNQPTVGVNVGVNLAFPLKITSSVNFSVLPQFASKRYDAFCVGGGAGGAGHAYVVGGLSSGGGGGGGYTTTIRSKTLGATMAVNIGYGGSGASHMDYGHYGGGTTSLVSGEMNCSASGGKGDDNYFQGGDGGSGGGSYSTGGGSDGANGAGSRGGAGQGTTTRAFGESWGELFSGGGGSGGGKDGLGGAGGGGTYGPGAAGTGGGGASYSINGWEYGGCSGGSGTAIIRLAQ